MFAANGHPTPNDASASTSQPAQGAPPIDERPLTPDERNAMRAYLQRTEVRLSTLHRIAVAFIGGAGLLLLLPSFFKEEITVLIRLFIGTVVDEVASLSPEALPLHLALYASLLYPLLLSLAIPLYALYMLLKDVIHFYYTIHTPGFPDGLITPSFALSGVGFSPDESPEAKRRILAYQYQNEAAINFAIPFSAERRQQYFDRTIAATGGAVVPSTRTYEALAAHGVMHDGIDRQTVNRFGAAFGLARTLDRDLAHEVAISEMSLVRHIVYLRRLVLRYVKTLLMFIWTTLITFVMLPLAQTPNVPPLLILALGFMVWALLVMPVMRTPLSWIYRFVHGLPDDSHIDLQLTALEHQVGRWIAVAIVSGVVAAALAIWLYLLR